MTKIYKGQTALIMKLDTKINLANVATALMHYVKPDGETGEWVCATDTNNIISYVVLNKSDLDQSGNWKRWASLTFTDGSWAPGEPATFVVHDVGE